MWRGHYGEFGRCSGGPKLNSASFAHKYKSTNTQICIWKRRHTRVQQCLAEFRGIVVQVLYTMHSALCWCPAAMQRPGISSLLNVTSHLVSPVSPNISPRPTSNPVKMQSDVFHFCTTTLSCLNDQMLLLIMDGQDRQVHIVQVTSVQLYKSSFILVLSWWWQHLRLR